jgi:hypothetical protein
MKGAELGNAFPMALSPVGERNEAFIRPEICLRSLTGSSRTRIAIDLGCGPDGLVEKGTNKFGGVFLPEYFFGDETYTNLMFGAPGQANALGLRFLARHLVTLDFPQQMLYLKRTRLGALEPDSVKSARESDRSSAIKFLLDLRQNGQLPGFPRESKGAILLDHLYNSGSKAETFWFRAKGESATFHYKVNRAGMDGHWRLQKAWRTDEKSRTTEVFVVPKL